MQTIKIYSPAGGLVTEVTPDKNCLRRFSLMQQDCVVLKFRNREALRFPVGSRISIGEDDFFITAPQPGKWEAATGVWLYELTFEAYYRAWANKMLRYVTPGVDSAAETSFALTATIDVHAAMLKNCLDWLGQSYGGSPFRVQTDETVAGAEAKLVTYENVSVLGGLQAIAEAFECEWWVEGSAVCFGRMEHERADLRFEAGVNVSSITFQASTTAAPNRLYVFGSDRNLPPDYRATDAADTIGGVVNRRLMLPAGTPYLQTAADLPEEEVVERVVVLEDVYPRTGLTVTLDPEVYEAEGEQADGSIVRESFYRLSYGTGFRFSAAYLLPDEELHIVFRSGLLNGMDFGARFNPKGLNEKNADGSWNDAAQMIEVVANEDYGRKLPDAVLRPQKGDEFILYGWDATKMADLGLVADAEQELLEEGRKALEEYSKDLSSCTCPMAWDYIKALTAEGRAPRPGDSVTIIDTEHFGSEGRKSRIIGYEYPLDKPYAATTYTCGEAVSERRLDSMERKIEGLARSGQKVQIQNSLDFLSKRYADRTPYRLSSDTAFEAGNYVGGVSGGILGIDKGSGKSFAEVDDLWVRCKAYFESLTVIESETLAGRQYITPGGSVKCVAVRDASGRVKHEAVVAVDSEGNELPSVTDSHAEAYRCYYLEEQAGEKSVTKIIKGDQAISRTFNVPDGSTGQVTNHYWWRLVTNVVNAAYTDIDTGNVYGYIEVSATECDRNTDSLSEAGLKACDIPAEGDVIAQLGSRVEGKPERQSAIVLDTVGSDAPSIKLFQGIDSFSLAGHDVVSFGYNPTTGKADMRVYGDTYIGDRGGSTFMKFDEIAKQLSIKGKIVATSPIVDEKGEDTGKTIGELKSDLESQQEEIAVAQDWIEKNAPELATLKNTLASYDYIKAAIKDGKTTVNGGLLLSSLIKVGSWLSTDPNKPVMEAVLAGLNGIYNSKALGGGIASWWGGDMIDRFDINGNLISPAPANAAMGLVRMDGSYYFSGGNILGNLDGSARFGSEKDGLEITAQGGIKLGSGVKFDVTNVRGLKDSLDSLANFNLGLSRFLVPWGYTDEDEDTTPRELPWEKAALKSTHVLGLKTKEVGFFSETFLSARGASTGSSGGSGTGGSGYGLYTDWANKILATDALSAQLGKELRDAILGHTTAIGDLSTSINDLTPRVKTAEDNLSSLQSSLNVATGDITTLQNSLANYVTLNSAQNISGIKTFKVRLDLSNDLDAMIRVIGKTSGGQAAGIHYYNNSASTRVAGIGYYATMVNGEPTAPTNMTSPILFMGWGKSPWVSANNLSVGDGQFTYKNNNVLHAGNYAATLDTRYVTLGTAQTITGTKTFKGCDILFSDSGTTTRQIRFTVGTNDYARIAAGATAENKGWLEIATADDNDEPIYVRQYRGPYTQVIRTLTLLDASGNTTLPGQLNANGGIVIPSTKTLKIGDATISWDGTALKIDKPLYSTNSVSARGLSTASGGSTGTGSGYGLYTDKTWATKILATDALAASVGKALRDDLTALTGTVSGLSGNLSNLSNSVRDNADLLASLQSSLGNYVKKAGDTMTGTLTITNNSSLVIKHPEHTGGTAKSVYFKDSDGTNTYIFGSLLNNHVKQHAYIGWGTNPWNESDCFAVSESKLKYKGQDVLHLGNYAATLDARYLKLSGGTMTNTNVVTNLNADLLDGMHASQFASGGRARYKVTSTAVGWIRVAVLNSTTARGIVSVCNTYWDNPQQNVQLYVCASHYNFVDNFALVQVGGCGGTIWKKARIVFSGSDDSAEMYLELYYNSASANNTLSVELSGAYMMTALQAYTAGSVPTGYKTKEIDLVNGISGVPAINTYGSISRRVSDTLTRNVMLHTSSDGTDTMVFGDVLGRTMLRGGEISFQNVVGTTIVKIRENKVGIGTLTPDALLHVNGNVKIEGSINAINSIFMTGAERYIWGVQDIRMSRNLMFLRDGASSGYYISPDEDGKLRFLTIDGNWSWVKNVAAFDSTGRFGIGTMSPSYLLHLVGASTTTRLLHVNGWAGALRFDIVGTANSNAYLTADATTNAYLNAGGSTLMTWDGSTKAVRPGTSMKGAVDLGTSAYCWRSLYLTTSLKIGDATISWDSTAKALKVDRPFYSTNAVSARGISTASGGSSSGTGSGYGLYTDTTWASDPLATDALSAKLGQTLHGLILGLDKSVIDHTTDIRANTKSISALTSRVETAESSLSTLKTSLGNYVTLGTAQTITGIKTFSNGFKVGTTSVVTKLNADMVDGYHVGSALNSIPIWTDFPAHSVLKEKGYLPADFNATTEPTNERYFKALLQWATATYSGAVLLMGKATPNAQGFLHLAIYSTALQQDGLPQHSYAVFHKYGGEVQCFGTMNYVWRWNYATYCGSLNGNAASATKLATARTINQTAFDGTEAIVTKIWGTTRTLWGQSCNGGANISGAISNAGYITPITSGQYGIGSSTMLWGHMYLYDRLHIRPTQADMDANGATVSRGVYIGRAVLGKVDPGVSTDADNGKTVYGVGMDIYLERANSQNGLMMRFTQQHRIGVFNSSPAYPLDITGETRITAASTALLLKSGGTHVTGMPAGLSTNGALNVQLATTSSNLLLAAYLPTESATLSTRQFMMDYYGPSNYLYFRWRGSIAAHFGASATRFYGTLTIGPTTGSAMLSYNTTAAGLQCSTGFYTKKYLSSRGIDTDSDARLKTRIAGITLSIRDIARAPLWLFRWNDTGEHDSGSVAQYWERILPHVVRERDHKTLDYSKAALISVVTAAREIARHDQEIAQLRQENRQLRHRIAKLEARPV